jgi:hypothetical protein
MSRVTVEDLRGAFRLRAIGRPGPGLRHRIREGTRLTQEPGSKPAIGGLAHRRPVLARLSAVAAVAAGVILAPVVFGGFDAERLDPVSDSRGTGQISAGHAFTDGENDRNDDDVGDDEDGFDDDRLGDDDDDLGDDDDDLVGDD